MCGVFPHCVVPWHDVFGWPVSCAVPCCAVLYQWQTAKPLMIIQSDKIAAMGGFVFVFVTLLDRLQPFGVEHTQQMHNTCTNAQQIMPRCMCFTLHCLQFEVQVWHGKRPKAAAHGQTAFCPVFRYMVHAQMCFLRFWMTTTDFWRVVDDCCQRLEGSREVMLVLVGFQQLLFTLGEFRVIAVYLWRGVDKSYLLLKSS